MSRLVGMTLEGAVNNSKLYIKELAPAISFNARFASERSGLRPLRGKPTLTVRYAGDQDDGGGITSYKLPRLLVFQIRIYYPILPEQRKNALEEAQRQCLAGDSAWRENYYQDISMGDRFSFGSIIENVETGEMLDPDGVTYYGHELTVVGQLH